ncbi:MAG TPA: hypothetical protein VIG72_02060, partial [Pontibacter sp.]
MKQLLLTGNYFSPRLLLLIMPTATCRLRWLGAVLLTLFLYSNALPAAAQLTEVWRTPPYKHSSGAGAGFVQQEVDRAGNLVVLGSELTLYKYDATGRQLWSVRYDAGANVSRTWSEGLWVDKAGNSYVLGEWFTTSSVYENILLKYSAGGELLWSKVYTGTSGTMESVQTLTLDAQDNVYLTGELREGNTSIMVTQKLSGTGTVLWTSKAEGLQSGQVIAADNKGSVFVLTSGRTIVTGIETTALLKYDAATGVELLRKAYSTPGSPDYSESPKKLLFTAGGEMYAIIGTTKGNDEVLNVLLYKLAADGTLLFKEQVGETLQAVFYDVVLTTTDELIFLCRLHEYRRPTWDHFMVKVNASGKQVWLHKFNVYEAENMVRYFAPSRNGLAVKADGSIVIAGSYSRFRIPPTPASSEVYTEYPKFILATFSKDGEETWRQVLDLNTSREGNSGVDFIDGRSLYFTGSTRNTADLSTPVNLVTMKFTDCAGFTASAGADKEICKGGNVQLQASGGTTYSWAPAAGLSATNIANPVASPAETTTYTVTVTNADGCTDTDQVVVKVTAAPTVTITPGGPTTFCEGGFVTLSVSAGSASTYQWLQDGSPINQATSSSFTTHAGGNFSVRVTGSGG